MPNDRIMIFNAYETRFTFIALLNSPTCSVAVNAFDTQWATKLTDNSINQPAYLLCSINEVEQGASKFTIAS